MKEDIDEDRLIRYILGEANAEEKEQVTLWAEANELNARKLEEFKFILDSGKKMAAQSPADENAQWEKFKLKQAGATTNVRAINSNVKWLQMAAAAVVLIGGLLAGLYFYAGKTNVKGALILFKTEKDIRTVTLPDGSEIVLNSYSGVSYSSDFLKNRSILLNGEAFFKVKHDASSPFVVRTGSVKIQDIGTAFNVRSKAQQVEVVVESGSISVHENNLSANVNAREKIRINAGDKQLHVEKNNDLLYTYYRSNEFVADNTPLWQVVETLNDAYSAHIAIENNSLRNIPLTVTLKRESLDKVLQVIASTIPEIHLVKNGDNIVLK